ncbi:hypothetical protein PsAD37_03701 [Pseudovibrio sp. Ad37]|nr:hypothetical protein PsAD37_03701 [Pseudovibrio sp. Ad37]
MDRSYAIRETQDGKFWTLCKWRGATMKCFRSKRKALANRKGERWNAGKISLYLRWCTK